MPNIGLKSPTRTHISIPLLKGCMQGNTMRKWQSGPHGNYIPKCELDAKVTDLKTTCNTFCVVISNVTDEIHVRTCHAYDNEYLLKVWWHFLITWKHNSDFKVKRVSFSCWQWTWAVEYVAMVRSLSITVHGNHITFLNRVFCSLSITKKTDYIGVWRVMFWCML